MTTLLYKWLERHTVCECPRNFLRWSVISATATMLERNVFAVNGKPIYPNMYVMLVGSPATRKSTAIKPMGRLLRGAGYDRFAPNKCSKQQFIRGMAAGGDDMLDTWESVDSTYINTDEFLDFIGMGNTEFTVALTHLWDNHSDYKEEYRKDKVLLMNPTVNMLSGATPTNLLLGLPAESGGTGFLSRTIMVYGEPSRDRVTWLADDDAVFESVMSDELAGMRQLKGQMSYTSAAKALINDIYQNFQFLEDTRLMYYNGRRLDHLMKLCIVIAAMHHSMTITADHVLEANTILVYTEESMHKAFGEFGKSKYSEVYGKITAYIENAGRPVKVDELYRAVGGDLDSMQDMFKILDSLLKSARIQNSSTGAFITCKRTNATQRTYTDFDKYISEVHIYDKYTAEQNELRDRLAALAKQRTADGGKL